MFSDAYEAGQSAAHHDLGIKEAADLFHGDPGLAQGLHASQFPSHALHVGTELEHLEHGLPLHRAQELAMDHLLTDPGEYNRPGLPLHKIDDLKKTLLGGRNLQAERGHTKQSSLLDKATPVTGGRFLRHVLGGAGLGGLTGAAVSEDPREGAMRGALYGAAGGVGVAHKTNPIMRRRFEELQRVTREAPNLASRLHDVADLAPDSWKRTQKIKEHLATKANSLGGSKAREARYHQALVAKEKNMAAQDLGERLTEGTVGGALGLGLGAGAGAVYDRVRGPVGASARGEPQPTYQPPMYPYGQPYLMGY